MCGLKSKTLWLALAVLLLLPCYSFSSVTLTDEEAIQLNQELENSKKELNGLREKLSEQKTQLSEAKNELTQAKNELSNAKDSLTKSQKELEGQKDTLKQLRQSLKEQQREARWKKVKAFCIGLAVGAVGGIAGGYYLAR